MIAFGILVLSQKRGLHTFFGQYQYNIGRCIVEEE